MRIVALLVCHLLASCNTIETQPCDWGIVCPPEKICHAPTQTCVLAAQQAVCTDQPEWANCAYPGASAGTHFCRNGLCVPALCGNGVLDQGESCDGTQLLTPYCADIPGGGYRAGVPGCTAECVYDTSPCWEPGWATLETNGDRHLYAVDGTASGLVVAAGLGSTVQVLDRDSGRFIPLDGFSTICSPGNERLQALDLTPAGDRLLAVGDACQAYVARLDGAHVTSCQRHTLCDVGPPRRLKGVWALPDHSRAWVPALDNRLYVYDDASETWEEQVLSYDTRLFGVWGRSASEVYVAGDGGYVLRWDGTLWRDLQQPLTTEVLQSVWGPADGTEIYVVGDEGAVLLRDANGWTDLNSDRIWTSGLGWRDVRGAGDSDLWLVGRGGMVAQFDGSQWQLQWISPFNLEGVSLSEPGGEVLVVGGFGTAMRYRGRYWSEVTWEETMTLRATALLPDGTLLAVGEGGLAIRLSGATYSSTAPTGFSPTMLQGLWAGERTVLAVGSDGAVCTLDADLWSCAQNAPGISLTAVSGREHGDDMTAVAVGSSGSVYRFDGSSWTPDDTFPGVGSLFGVWMDPDPIPGDAEIFAVGSGGAVWHYTAGLWQSVELPWQEQLDLYAVTGSASHVVAVGDVGEVVQLDRQADHWTRTSIGHQPFFSVWLSSSSPEGFAVGQGSPVYFDGTAWSVMAPTVLCKGDPWPMRALAGTSSRNVYSVGDKGCVLHFTGRMPAGTSTTP